MGSGKDLYAILEVEPAAAPDAIKRAFRALARRWHPDKNGAVGAEDRFKDISKAYETLKDADKRRHYDNVRKGALEKRSSRPTETAKADAAGAGPGGGADGGTKFRFRSSQGDDAGSRRERAATPPKSRPDRRSFHFDFRDADEERKNGSSTPNFRFRFSFMNDFVFGHPFEDMDDVFERFFSSGERAFRSARDFGRWSGDDERRSRARQRFGSREDSGIGEDDAHEDEEMWDWTRPVFRKRRNQSEQTRPSQSYATSEDSRSRAYERADAQRENAHERRGAAAEDSYKRSSRREDSAFGAAQSRTEAGRRRDVRDHEQRYARTEGAFGRSESAATASGRYDDGEAIRLSCSVCGRKFGASELEVHVAQCRLLNNRTSGRFAEANPANLGASFGGSPRQRRRPPATSAPDTDTDDDHEINSSEVYQACPKCNRSFSQSAAQRHIANCKIGQSNDSVFPKPKQHSSHIPAYSRRDDDLQSEYDNVPTRASGSFLPNIGTARSRHMTHTTARVGRPHVSEAPSYAKYSTAARPSPAGTFTSSYKYSPASRTSCHQPTYASSMYMSSLGSGTPGLYSSSAGLPASGFRYATSRIYS